MHCARLAPAVSIKGRCFSSLRHTTGPFTTLLTMMRLSLWRHGRRCAEQTAVTLWLYGACRESVNNNSQLPWSSCDISDRKRIARCRHSLLPTQGSGRASLGVFRCGHGSLWPIADICPLPLFHQLQNNHRAMFKACRALPQVQSFSVPTHTLKGSGSPWRTLSSHLPHEHELPYLPQPFRAREFVFKASATTG